MNTQAAPSPAASIPQAPRPAEDHTETAVVSAATALAVVFALGLAAQQAGLLDSVLGGLSGRGALAGYAPVLAFVKAEAGGDPPRMLLAGTVASAGRREEVEQAWKKAFPGTEWRTAIAVNDKLDAKREMLRVSIVAAELSEAWPRPRFGAIKRMELQTREDRTKVYAVVYDPKSQEALEAAVQKMPKALGAVAQVKSVVRPAMPAAELQTSLVTTLRDRQVGFTPTDGGLQVAAADFPLLDEVAPLLRNLAGLEVLVVAGHPDRATAFQQATALKDALVARGADGAGLRPVPGPVNNPLALIVKEKE